MKLAVLVPADTYIIVDEDLSGCLAETLAKATYHKKDDNGYYVAWSGHQPDLKLVPEEKVVYHAEK